MAAVSPPAAAAQPNPSAGLRPGSAGWGQPVYVVGRLAPQAPTIGVEKELATITAGAFQGGELEVGLLRQVLDNPADAYLGRHLCWIVACQDVDALTVMPRDDAEIQRLAGALSAAEDVVNVIVGKTVPAASDWPCAAAGLPAVQADQVLAFTLKEFAAKLLGKDSAEGEPEEDAAEGLKLPGEDEIDDVSFQAVRAVFLRLTRGAGNRGFTDEHRARNYVAVRYPGFYHAAIQARRDGKVLVGVEAQHSHSAGRRVVAVRLILRHPRTDITEQYQCLVDATEVLPFLVTGLQPVYD